MYNGEANVSETVLDRHVVTSGHYQEVIFVDDLSSSRKCNNLECSRRSFPIANLSSAIFRIYVRLHSPSASAELLVCNRKPKVS